MSLNLRPDLLPNTAALKRDKQLLGLAYGLLAGLTYTLATWGYDGWLLAHASADSPWLKLVIGGIFCLLVGALVGWLTEVVDRSLFGLVAWILAGMAFAWFAGHLPFEGESIITGLLDPGLRGLDVYPFAENIQLRLVLIYIVVVVTSGIAGLLETFLVESARGAPPLLRWLTIGVCIPFFALGGNSTANINETLTGPIQVIDQTIQFALKTEGTQVDPQLVRETHLLAVEPIKSLLHRPRKLILGYYEPTYLNDFSVYIDFDGVWAVCQATVDLIGNCQPSDHVYAEKMACLLQAKPGTANACSVSVKDAAKGWLEAWGQQLGSSPQVKVRNQRGAVTLLTVWDQDGRAYNCRFRETPDFVLEACTPFPSPTPPPQTAPAASPEISIPTAPAPTQAFNAPVVPAAQEVALLQADKTDLLSVPDLTRYLIQVDINYPGHTLQGQASLVYTNTENTPLESVYFRLIPNGHKSYGDGSLTVTQVTIDGQPAETQLTLSDSVLEVHLPKALKPGTQVRFGLGFSGLVPVDFGGDKTPEGYGIYNLSNGVLALADWYPILAVYDAHGWNLDPVSGIGDSVYSDMALYTIDITIGSELTLAATGVEISRMSQGGISHYRYVSGPARDFFMIASPDFQVKSGTVDGIKINSYYLAQHSDAGQSALDIAERALHTYNTRFGPYPYTELDVIDASIRNASGVEFPGIILVGDQLYGDPDNPSFMVATAHEVAHQWWYNVVGNNVLDEPWLDEALTTYSSAVYFESTPGVLTYRGLLDYWQNRYNDLVRQGGDDLVTQNVMHFEKLGEKGAYGPVVYTKGALFFAALREAIGDQAFFEALRSYYATYKYRIATAQDLLNMFETKSGKQLDELYQKWLYSRQPPP